jgi:hypothetical protein
MRAIFRLTDLVFRDKSRDWKQESSRVQELLNCLHTSGLWWDFQYFSTNGGRKYKRLSNPDQFVQGMAAEKRASACILVPRVPKREEMAEREEEKSLPHELHIDLKGAALSLLFIVQGELLKQQTRLLDQFVELASQLQFRFGQEALLGPELYVDIDLSIPRLRPQRTHILLRRPLFFLSQEFQRSHRLGNPEELDKMLRAPMSPGASRELRGDLVIFRWVDDLSEPRRVREALVAQQKWLVDVVNPPLHSSYNELGDQHQMVTGQAPSEYLTFKDAFTSQGFKAMAIHPDASVDEDTLDMLDRLAEWNKSGKLPDGSLVHGMSLILPNRESALRIHPLAEARGIPNVLYLDDQGRLWNPFPSGAWIDYPVSKS